MKSSRPQVRVNDSLNIVAPIQTEPGPNPIYFKRLCGLDEGINLHNFDMSSHVFSVGDNHIHSRLEQYFQEPLSQTDCC